MTCRDLSRRQSVKHLHQFASNGSVCGVRQVAVGKLGNPQTHGISDSRGLDRLEHARQFLQAMSRSLLNRER